LGKYYRWVKEEERTGKV